MFNSLQSFPLGRGACEIKIMKLISVTGHAVHLPGMLLGWQADPVLGLESAKHTVTSPPVAFKFSNPIVQTFVEALKKACVSIYESAAL